MTKENNAQLASDNGAKSIGPVTPAAPAPTPSGASPGPTPPPTAAPTTLRPEIDNGLSAQSNYEPTDAKLTQVVENTEHL